MFDTELELEAALEDVMSVLAESDLESEIAESDGEGELDPFRAARDLWVVASQGGERDENKLTDSIFYDRHPNWKGRALKNAALPLRQEWIAIRDNVVRPYLKNYPAQAPAPVAPVPQPAAPQPAPTTPGPVSPAERSRKEPAGYSSFENILKCEPWKYPYAISTQARYRKVLSFFPYFVKINGAVRNVKIDLDDHGVGNLLFSMDGGSLKELVESNELQSKIFEMSGGALAHQLFHFSEAAIEFLGLGLTLFDLYSGLQREQRFFHDPQWRTEQQFKFVFALMAEDLVRRDLGSSIFVSRNSRDLAVELAKRFKEFRPIWSEYVEYRTRDENLAQWACNIPDPATHPEPPRMYPYP